MPAISLIIIDDKVNMLKNIPLLAIPKCLLKSGIKVSMVPKENAINAMVIADGNALGSNMSSHLSFNKDQRNRCFTMSVSGIFITTTMERRAKPDEQ